MGCSDSKTADNDNQKPKEDQKPKDKQENQQAEDNQNRDWVTKEEAVQYVVKEMDVEKEMAEQFVDTFDKNEDNKIRNQELVDLYNQIQTSKKEIEPLFQEIDQDNKGYVSCEQAAQVMKQKFDGFDDEQLQKMAKGFDANDNDQCNYVEFIWMYTHMKARRRYLLTKFDSLDADGSGQLQRPEVVAFLMHHCMLKSQFQADFIFFNNAGDDMVMNLEEFKTMYNKLFPE